MPDFRSKSKKNYNNYYDIHEDYALIEASFLQQYGIRLRNVEDLTWDEFCIYLSGLNDTTPLGKIISIRSEKDPKVIKNFTADQKKIRRDWEKKMLANMTDEEKREMEINLQKELSRALSHM